MEGNNNAPFEKGQKVIALKDGWMTRDYLPAKAFSKGDVFKVLSVVFCCKWKIDVGVRVSNSPCGCPLCNYDSGVIAYADAKLFAPIETRDHELVVDKEIWDSLPKETEERSDVVVKPQEASVQNRLLETIDEMIALLPKIPFEQRFAYADRIVEAINRTCKIIRGESCS